VEQRRRITRQQLRTLASFMDEGLRVNLRMVYTFRALAYLSAARSESKRG
jgi:hypothetical protein